MTSRRGWGLYSIDIAHPLDGLSLLACVYVYVCTDGTRIESRPTRRPAVCTRGGAHRGVLDPPWTKGGPQDECHLSGVM